MFFNISQRTDFSLTQRIELFYDAKNWSFFCKTQRTFFLWIWRKELNLLMRRKELSLFLNMTQRIESFFEEKSKIWTSYFQEYDSKNWTLCQKKKDSKNWTLLKWLIELNLFLWTSSQYDSKSWSLFAVWLQEFNFSRVFQYDSKNWTFFWVLTPRVELFFFLNLTQRIEPLFEYDSIFKGSKNWASFLEIRLKELNSLNDS